MKGTRKWEFDKMGIFDSSLENKGLNGIPFVREGTVVGQRPRLGRSFGQHHKVVRSRAAPARLVGGVPVALV